MTLQSEISTRRCSHCSRSFTHKSSLVRHSKRCLQDIRAPSRQRSCHHCTLAKAACDRQRPNCGRCRTRSLDCVFTTSLGYWGQEGNFELQPHNRAPPAQHNTPLRQTTEKITASSNSDDESRTVVSQNQGNIAPQLVLSPQRRQVLLGTAPGVPTSDAAVRHTMHFVIRVLKSWPRLIAIHNFALLPPVIHRVQVKDSLPDPLANCHALVSMWASHKVDSSVFVQETIQREVKRLLDQMFNEFDLLAAAQSILMLLIVLYFGFELTSERDARLLVATWDVKHALAATGLFLEEEASHDKIPPWRNWAIVSAKRRTILALNHLEPPASPRGGTSLERDGGTHVGASLQSLGEQVDLGKLQDG
ncbi:unnamed protein product [Periconia digitata]|uniref:Zn(2)-C6 fungal-type domain-containing protein n=1 Tax=Periconia digitata TaxID=1303443 RepID=A0A9W4UIF1_9PLEO|nr:unnamed protein product [Periconia digitata]